MRRAVRRGRRFAAAVITLCLVTPAGVLATGGAAAGATVGEVPVLGRTRITLSNETSGVYAVALVHGVRRVPGGTVLYYSVGFPEGAPLIGIAALTQYLPDNRYGTGSTQLGAWVLVDSAGRKAYSVLVDDQKNALASPRAALPDQRGAMYTLYQVVPELPAAVERVDVLIGHADVVQGVPVENGPLEPAIEQTGPMPLGTGWPQIDLQAVAASVAPEQSIHPLRTAVSDREGTVITREKAEQVSVDLAADVLFALDSATLTPAARSKIERATAILKQRGVSGRVQVVGHTDSSGTDAHNDALSQRRARAVADRLRGLLGDGLTLDVQGRGEREPVASNDTAAGRKANRRVSIVYQEAAR